MLIRAVKMSSFSTTQSAIVFDGTTYSQKHMDIFAMYHRRSCSPLFMAFVYQMNYGNPNKSFILDFIHETFEKYLEAEWGYTGEGAPFMQLAYELITRMHKWLAPIPPKYIALFHEDTPHAYNKICSFLPTFYTVTATQFIGRVSSCIQYSVDMHKALSNSLRSARASSFAPSAAPSFASSAASSFASTSPASSLMSTVHNSGSSIGEPGNIFGSDNTSPFTGGYEDVSIGNTCPNPATGGGAAGGNGISYTVGGSHINYTTVTPTSSFTYSYITPSFNSAAEVAAYENERRLNGLYVAPWTPPARSYDPPQAQQAPTTDENVYKQLPDSIVYIPVGVGPVAIGRRKRTIEELTVFAANATVQPPTPAVANAPRAPMPITIPVSTPPSSKYDGGSGNGRGEKLPFLEITVDPEIVQHPTDFNMTFDGYTMHYRLKLELGENDTCTRKSVITFDQLQTAIGQYVQYYLYEKNCHPLNLIMAFNSFLESLNSPLLYAVMANTIQNVFEAVTAPEYTKFLVCSRPLAVMTGC
jgi:hypothetical protein